MDAQKIYKKKRKNPSADERDREQLLRHHRALEDCQYTVGVILSTRTKKMAFASSHPYSFLCVCFCCIKIASMMIALPCVYGLSMLICLYTIHNVVYIVVLSLWLDALTAELWPNGAPSVSFHQGKRWRLSFQLKVYIYSLFVFSFHFERLILQQCTAKRKCIREHQLSTGYMLNEIALLLLLYI